MSEEIEVFNALITGTRLGFEHHDIFTYTVLLEMDGSGIGFGGYALCEWDKEKKERTGTDFGTEAIMRLLKVVGVEYWEDLKGKNVRIKTKGGWGGTAVAIGHIIKDKWLNLTELANSMGCG